MSLHGKERAVWRRLGMGRNIHTAEVWSAGEVWPVHNSAIGKYVSEGAFYAEFAVSLERASGVRHVISCDKRHAQGVSHFCEVFARCSLSDGLIGMEKRT
jgi:hypothetical protein